MGNVWWSEWFDQLHLKSTCTYMYTHTHVQATIPVHQNKRAEVTQMVAVGDGVWLSFKYDSILRLFHAATYTHIQDLDVAPSVQRVLGELVYYS